MIRLAQLVTGRLETDEDAQDVRETHEDYSKPSNNYGISRLGLTPDAADTSEALRPSFGDEVERRLQTSALPAPSAEVDKPHRREHLHRPSAEAAPNVEAPVNLPDSQPRGYKKTSVKMPRDMAVRLKAYARATGNYQYAVIAEAVGRFLDEAVADLSEDSRRRMREMAEQFQQAENRSRWREVFTFRWK